MSYERLRFDGVENWLANDLGRDVTTIEFTHHLTHAGGRAFPNLGEGPPKQYIALSILDGEYRMSEIVWLVGYTEDDPRIGTILRGMEGTDPPKDHPAGRKVVHAATVMDYTLVQDHDKDPDAHSDLFDALRAYIDASIRAHNIDQSGAHTFLARTESPTFTGTATFENIDLKGKLDALPGAWIEVSYDELLNSARITIDGDIHIHGHRIVVSKDDVLPSPNTVWIKTFG